jgi:uncharacterized damage-inducible protein DinB
MQDDFESLYAYDRWANNKMLDACRKLSPEQYTAEPVSGWSSVRFTVWHIAAVTDWWLRILAEDADQRFRAEAEVPAVEDAARLLERAYQTFDALLPSLTPELLNTNRTCKGGGWTLVMPLWLLLRHVVNHGTYHRGQVASKLKRFGIEQAITDLPFWAMEQMPGAILRQD